MLNLDLPQDFLNDIMTCGEMLQNAYFHGLGSPRAYADNHARAHLAKPAADIAAG